MKDKLAAQDVELAQKTEETDKLLAVVGKDTERVSDEKKIADEEEKKVQKINEDVTKKQQDCQRDLSKAEPALHAAEAALNTLNKVLMSAWYLSKRSIRNDLKKVLTLKASGKV